MIPVAHGGGGDSGGVGPTAGLGDRHCPPFRLAAAKTRQKALALRGRASGCDGGAAKTRAGDAEVKPGIPPREFLDEDGGP